MQQKSIYFFLNLSHLGSYSYLPVAWLVKRESEILAAAECIDLLIMDTLTKSGIATQIEKMLSENIKQSYC